ncbi:MAG: carboxypeptidase-like regulatory domain-containing protein, partial [Candidatus Woesearchaeota archaeon]
MMNVRFFKQFLVVFLLTNLMIISASFTSSADCYVRSLSCSNAATCNTWETTAQPRECITMNDGGRVCSTDSRYSLDDKFDGCEVWCCCIGGASYPSMTTGICNDRGGQVYLLSNDEAACTAACGLATNKYNLSGTITYNNAVPETSLRVTLGAASVMTNTTGGFSFTDINQGTYTLSVDYNCDYTETIALYSNTPSHNIQISCPPINISGVINDSLNQPITVIANVTATTGDGQKFSVLTTGSGRYVLYNIPQMQTLHIEANYTSGGIPCTGQTDITVTNINVTENIITSCTRHGFNVTVRYNGNPVTGATVRNNQSGVAVPVADRPGVYEFTNLIAGRMNFTASKIFNDYITPTHYWISDCNRTNTTIIPWYTTGGINFDNAHCCNITTRESQCYINTDGDYVQNITTTYVGSCSRPSVLVQSPCGEAPKVTCDWNCTTTCEAGKAFATVTCDRIETPECDINLPPPPMPNPIVPCVTTCGDGVVQTENGEECDYDYSSNPLTGDLSACSDEWDGMSNEDLLEMAYAVCNLNYCTCIERTEPPPVGECTPGYVAPDTSVNAIYSTNDFNITWGLNAETCNSSVDHFELSYCVNNSGQCITTVLNDSISEYDSYYVHEGTSVPVIANKSYCYFLTVVYNGSVPLDQQILTSGPVCIISGDERCMEPHDDYWCEGDSIVTCDSNNYIVESTEQEDCTGENQMCIMDGGDTASCITHNPALCDICNGVFGISSYNGYDIQVGPESTTPYRLSCPSIVNPAPTPSNTGRDPSVYYFGCYLDKSKTSLDFVYSCENVDICYDYKSEGACERDYCGKFTEMGESICTWKPYVNGAASNRFDKGVCVPIDTSEQECDLCEDPDYNPISNTCSANTCGLFGECYFDATQYGGNCMNEDEVRCSTYRDQTSCINGRNVITNVAWLSGNNDETIFSNRKVSGNNIRTPSLDLVGLGVCKWNSTSSTCYRDADNATYPYVNDCRIQDLMLNRICELDTQPPNTTIERDSLYYGLVMDLNGKVSITDNNPWQIGDMSLYTNNNWRYMRTFYCVDRITNPPCYPRYVFNTTAYTYKINLSSPWLYPNFNEAADGQTFMLRYFSEDPARNLELIKNFTFILDARKPNISLRRVMDTRQISMRQWVTDINFTIRLNSTDRSGNVSCYFNLTPREEVAQMVFEFYDNSANNIPSRYNPDANILGTTGDELHADYENLTDGTYDYYLTCIDNVGNKYSENNTLIIEGDLTLNNATPRGAVYNRSMMNSNLQITINATNIGQCRYSNWTYNFNDMMPFTGDGSLSSVRIAIVTTDTSRVYKYFVVCNLSINDDYEIVYGTDLDSPYFSIDAIPPNTKLMFKESTDDDDEWKEYFYDTTTYEQLDIKFECDDSNSTLMSNGRELVFGCGNMYYCIPNGTKTCINNLNEYTLVRPNEIIRVLDYSTLNSQAKQWFGNTPAIFYYSLDNGSNREEFKTTIVNVKNTDFDAPNITFSPAGVEYGGTTYVNSYMPIIIATYRGETLGFT